MNFVSRNPECRLLASASKDGTVRIWDVGLCKTMLVLSGHTHCVTYVRWGGEGLLYTSSQDRTIKVWRIKDVSLHGKSKDLVPIMKVQLSLYLIWPRCNEQTHTEMRCTQFICIITHTHTQTHTQTHTHTLTHTHSHTHTHTHRVCCAGHSRGTATG